MPGLRRSLVCLIIVVAAAVVCHEAATAQGAPALPDSTATTLQLLPGGALPCRNGTVYGFECQNIELLEVDIRTPTAPSFAGCYHESRTGGGRSSGYIHETQCTTYHGPDQQHQGREICLNSSETALGIADVTDRKQPKTISIATYPDVGFTHQGWFSENHQYFFLNDEFDEYNATKRDSTATVRTRTIVLDLKDLDDPVVLTEFYGPTPATDHNLYIRGRYMYQSNYTAGLRIIDVADPADPKEVGYLDTTPGRDEPGTHFGSWSNYPYFKNDVVAVTSQQEGLFLVRLVGR